MTHPRCRIAIVLCLSLAALAYPSAAARANVTPDEVAQSIKKGIDFLFSQQNADGNWDDPKTTKTDHHYGGYTCIAPYGLLAGGVSPQDPRLEKALKFIKVTNIKSIYALGMRAQVWTFLQQDDDLKRYILKDAELLIRTGFNESTGLYGYTTAHDGEHNSPSQYGVLGVWALEQCGIAVKPKYWEIVERTWKKNQGPDGGWQYSSAPPNPGQATPAFTAAGVATLFITQDYLHAAEGAKCAGNLENPNIEYGLKWMARNFAQVGANGYALYGVERIGVASGLKYFGDTDWYQTGAAALLNSQGADGSWGSWGTTPGTAWGIVFLTRGRAPVIMNKLQYDLAPTGRTARAAEKDKDGAVPKGKPGNWNQRPRDIANVTRWIAKVSERDLNWQIVNLNVPVDELHDAPILYIAGNQPLSFTKEQEDKLKQFIEQGGLILANADCASAAFTSSLKKLGERLFPAYKFAPLGAKHVINTEQRFPLVKMRSKPELQSMGNGARELIVIMPSGDPAKSWQMRAFAEQEPLFQVADNVYEYSVDKNARFKGETYIVTRDEKIKADRSLKLARLQYEGNWNPEPGGWRRLANLLHNERQVELTVETVKLGDGKLKPADYKAAHLTGTGKLALNDAQRKELSAFVEGGGTLVVDAAGGTSDFAQTAEQELGILFPDGAKNLQAPLKMEHLVFNIPQWPVRDVSYRGYARRVVGNAKSPLLRGIDVAGRTAVFFSREDLSVGLVGQAVDGIIGYDPRSASLIMGNVLLYASSGGVFAPATAPATTTTSPAAVPAPTTEPAASADPAK